MASLILAVIALLIPAIQAVGKTGLTFTVSGDDNIWVYADGQQVGSHSGWTDTTVIDLPYGTYSLAVQIGNIGGLGGLIGHITDFETNTIVTDASWKCTRTYNADWWRWYFDDNEWEWAVATRGMNDPDSRFNRPLIDSRAKWIWAGDYNYPGSTVNVYCRKYLSGFQFNVCGDDEVSVWADGVGIGTHRGWTTSTVFNIKPGTTTIGLQMRDNGGLGGVIGSLSNGIVTDSQWKCTRTFSGWWFNSDFNDSNWPQAVATRGQGDPDSRFTRSSIDASAKWIWAGDYTYTTQVYVYCRRTNVNNPCAGASPCANGGQCTATSGGMYKCTCAAGFAGTNCNTASNPCDSSPCLNGGKCKSTGTKFSCTCASGYSGATCNTAPGPCDSSPCLNGGACKVSGSTFACTCAAGYSGNTCNKASNPCDSGPCLNSGTCVQTSASAFTCYCPAGFAGATCNKLANPCDNTPCSNGATCVQTSGTTYTCNCAAGYTGPTCSKASNPCSSSPCLNGGACKASGSTFACTCSADYTGATCTTPTGPCASSPCQHGGTCVSNGAKDYDCYCVPDYDDGDNCVAYQDPCTSSPCFNGGTCVRTSALTFTCSCPAAYVGTYCEVPKGKDPCATNICQHGGKCKTISIPAGTYTCTCTNQYEGIMCEKIVCLNNPTTDCDLVGTAYGKYGYCGDCGSWSVCRAAKRKVRSCASRAPNVFFNRATRNCTATVTSCKGLPGY